MYDIWLWIFYWNFRGFPRISRSDISQEVIKTEHASENEVMENVLGNKPKIWFTLLEEHGSSIPIFYSDLRLYNGNITKQAKEFWFPAPERFPLLTDV